MTGPLASSAHAPPPPPACRGPGARRRPGRNDGRLYEGRWQYLWCGWRRSLTYWWEMRESPDIRGVAAGHQEGGWEAPNIRMAVCEGGGVKMLPDIRELGWGHLRMSATSAGVYLLSRESPFTIGSGWGAWWLDDVLCERGKICIVSPLWWPRKLEKMRSKSSNKSAFGFRTVR